MPRGNPSIWQHYGQSFAQLSATEARAESSRNASSSTTSGPSYAAGAPSTLPKRGVGTFIHQASWELTDKSKPAPTATETRKQYAAPEDYRRREMIRNDKSQFPKPNYPHEFKTLNQQDFSRDSLAGAQKMTPVKPVPNGNLIPHDIRPPAFNTSYLDQFPGRYQNDMRATARNPQAGSITTKHVGYNIITGGDSLGNHKFEAHCQGKDYRRMR